MWIVGEDFPRVPELIFQARLPCLQMVLGADRLLPAVESKIGRLSDEDAGDMVTLTDLAFPGSSFAADLPDGRVLRRAIAMEN